MKTKYIDELPDSAWLRTCQECFSMQLDKEPEYGKELTDAYRNRKCRRCKSEALDYGTMNARYDYDN